MKKTAFIIFALAILLSACGGQAVSEDDLNATAEVIALTIVAETREAMPPTNTPPPPATPTLIPSETPTEIPASPTATEPLETQTPAFTFTPVPTDTPAMANATNTPPPFVAPGNVAPLKFINTTKEEILFIFRTPIYKEYRFTKTFLTEVQFGEYTYVAWIGDQGPFYGTIFINNADKWELEFRADKIIFRIP